jgi:hypothetical protein
LEQNQEIASVRPLQQQQQQQQEETKNKGENHFEKTTRSCATKKKGWIFITAHVA